MIKRLIPGYWNALCVQNTNLYKGGRAFRGVHCLVSQRWTALGWCLRWGSCMSMCCLSEEVLLNLLCTLQAWKNQVLAQKLLQSEDRIKKNNTITQLYCKWRRINVCLCVCSLLLLFTCPKSTAGLRLFPESYKISVCRTVVCPVTRSTSTYI